MAERGPVPKRSTQRRRVNKPAAGEPTVAPAAVEVERPEADLEWHPVAVRWFTSLAQSGQSRFYEPSDWATAYLLAESISRELSPHQVALAGQVYTLLEAPRGAALAAWLKGMTALLATEGDRRRAAIELQRGEGEEADGVSWLDDVRDRLGQSG